MFSNLKKKDSAWTIKWCYGSTIKNTISIFIIGLIFFGGGVEVLAIVLFVLPYFVCFLFIYNFYFGKSS